jgi:HEAT repeat protein
MAAAKKLGWFGPAGSEAVPALIEALKTDYLRRDAVQSLGKIGHAEKAAIPAVTALQDQDLMSTRLTDPVSACDTVGRLIVAAKPSTNPRNSVRTIEARFVVI